MPDSNSIRLPQIFRQLKTFTMSTSTIQRPSKASPNLPTTMRFAGLWIIWVAWSCITGWSLSALGALHNVGYLASLPVLIITATLFWRHTAPPYPRRYTTAKWLRRITSSYAITAWGTIAALVLIGAIAHVPSNYDGVTYRLPRLLFWLQENRWHWIEGLDHRQNVSAVGHEWMMAPFIAITRSDRALFLINFIPFLLLPGLFFTAARGMCMRLQVAKWWMWVWPLAYGITMQAGSIGNDLLPAALALASLAFAAEAKRSRPALCLFFSALAAAAATGSKSTTLPLGLPLGIYWCWVAWNTLSPRDIIKVTCAAIPLAIPCSFLPLAIACIHYTGHWSGDPGKRSGAQAKHPVAGIIGNSIEIGCGLLQPPILPSSKKINETIKQAVEDQPWYQWTKMGNSRFAFNTGGEIPIEEYSGAGIGITLLLLTAVVLRQLDRRRYANACTTLQWVMLISTLVALLAFMSKMGTGGIARLSLPYLAISLLCLLFFFRKTPYDQALSGRLLQLIPALCLLPGLILNPNRPLLPMDALAAHPSLPASYRQRIESVYQAYQNRSSILTPLLENIPLEDTIGFAGGGNHSAIGLFKPYGKRKVLSLNPSNENSADWIVGTSEGIEKRMGVSFQDWEAKKGYELVKTKEIISLAATGPETWYIYKRLQP
jgi:hypothetical protein